MVENKFLYVGPMPPPFHGQSLAFSKLVEVAPKGIVINTGFSSGGVLRKLLFNIYVVIKILKMYFILSPKYTVYFTCSRTYMGSIRDIALLIVSKLKRCKVVNHLHGADFKLFYERVNPLFRLILKASYSTVTHHIVLADSMRSQFDMFHGSSIKVVNNFYDSSLDGFPVEKKLASGFPYLEVLFLSNLMPTKGLFVLLEAIKIINKKTNFVRFKIAGDFISDYERSASDVKDDFFKFIEELSNVNYLGVVTGSTKFELLVATDVFVLPTYHRSEAVPLSIFEAMAAGCAVITTAHNFLPSIVCPEGTTLVEPRDSESLAKSILTYLEDPSILYKHKSANVVFSNSFCSESVYIDKLLNILHD